MAVASDDGGAARAGGDAGDPIPGVGPGTILGGRYEVVRVLGAGGMGAVFEAVHRAIGRRVAVKLLRPAVAFHAAIVERFLREARVANDVRHRNIVEVLDFGVDDGRPYLVMDLLRGESFAALLARAHTLAAADVLRYLGPVLRALSYAHERGVVHRDVKPDNIFVAREDGTGDEVPKLLDFGIARATEEPGARLTATGVAMGTPVYMAPEQAAGSRDVGPAADQYAAGCVLYEALGGRPPHVAESYNALIVQKAMSDAPPLAALHPRASPAFTAAVMRAIEREPAARFASVADLLRALEAAASTGATEAPPATDALALASTMPSLRPPSGVNLLGDPPAPPPVAPASPAPARRARGRWTLAAAGLAVLTAGALAVRAVATRAPPGSPAREHASTDSPAGVILTVDYEPAEAEILLDGRSVGRHHAVVPLPRDGHRHELRVEAAGYEPQRRTLGTEADTVATGSLERLAPRAAEPADLPPGDAGTGATRAVPVVPAVRAPVVRRGNGNGRLQVSPENPLR